jgi:hypothetical protein
MPDFTFTVPPDPQPEPTPESSVAISFDRWFTTTGRPDYHKAGMQAYADTDGKRLPSEWDTLFANY